MTINCTFKYCQYYLLAVPLIVFIGGCGTNPVRTERTESPATAPLVTRYEQEGPSNRDEPKSGGKKEDSDLAVPNEPIGLGWAITNALAFNPRIRAFSNEIRAREALRKDAGLYPNPELEGELENVGGSGPLAGFDGAETKALGSQEILLGGKLRKRTRVAALEKELAQWNYEAERLEVVTETTLAFLDTLAGQQRVALAKELVQRAEAVYNTVKEQVEAGEVSSVELKRARIPLERRRIELNEARSQLQSARQRLASQWGKESADFQRVEGRLDNLRPVPEAQRILTNISDNPDLGRWVSELEHRRARFQLEKARQIPNIKLKGGIKNDQRGESQTTYIAGISIPLQLFDRNQYEVKAAKARVQRTQALREEIFAETRAEVEAAYRKMEAVHEEARRLKKTSLPNAREAYQAVQEGFQAGKFSFLDVLEAQRTLFDVQEQLLTAQARYQKSISKLERLIGRSLSALPQGNAKSAD